MSRFEFKGGGILTYLIALAALAFLMYVAYRGYSVILMAPLAAMGAVLLTDPSAVAPLFSGLFMEKMVSFIKLYFPVFILGALFGKLIEISGYAKAIVAAGIRGLGDNHAIVITVAVCALLTYGGVSLFVVVFAVYPFAAELFRQSDIPKRLLPSTIALGAFSFTMDALPGTPQIQNIIPTAFFGTTTWAAPWLGMVGSLFILMFGLAYLYWRSRCARAAGENYASGVTLLNEPTPVDIQQLVSPWLALSPLVVVGIANFAFTRWIAAHYGATYSVLLPGIKQPMIMDIKSVNAVWALEAALLVGILLVFITAFNTVRQYFAEDSKAAVSGAILAAMNSASEYGFGAVIATLPGFIMISDTLQSIPNLLINAAFSVGALVGITGSASGGMSIALAAMSEHFIQAAEAAQIPFEVLHRVVAMASGGMDTLPHNGAIITLLAVTGLTHRQAYKDIFAITCIKTLAVFFIILIYYATRLV